MKKAILYIHGKGGSFAEAEQFKKNCPGYDVTGLDYEPGFPWIVNDVVRAGYDDAAARYDSVTVIANSIGAFYTMNALQGRALEKALFISPILDMEKLICDMMRWANVTEQELRKRKEIPTDFGETLSWDYLQYVRDNPVDWNVPTRILYAGRDNLTSRDTVEAFAKSHDAAVTVMDSGEHWFHTDEQIAFLDRWMREAVK